MNWDKSMMLTIRGQDLQIPDVQKISKENPYEHLGIPVGVDIEEQKQEFWIEMLEKFTQRVGRWLSYKLSTKGRVLAANALVMSQVRYAARFMEIPREIAKLLEKEYYKLV